VHQLIRDDGMQSEDEVIGAVLGDDEMKAPLRLELRAGKYNSLVFEKPNAGEKSCRR